MKALFDQVSNECSIKVTKKYSTSFSSAVKMLAPSIRQDIYNIYGFVRFADEIVDSFHDYDKEFLFDRFQKDLNFALDQKISLNPILNSFQYTVNKYNIPKKLITSFMNFEELNRTYFPNTDLSQLDENSKQEIIKEIESDFEAAFIGIKKLPIEARFGVYTAYRYYKKLLLKLKKTPSTEIKNSRIRVSDYQKVSLLAQCYFNFKLNIL